jgi:predicted nucleic acid-binding protein
MIAVCDMGPLHYLVLIGCDHVLPRLFDRVITARVVIEKEMADPSTPGPARQWAAKPPPWLEILEPRRVDDIPALGKPGMRGDGDRAIISIAREVGADFAVMDDVKARRELKKRVRGIVPLWTLEVLDEAAERGLIDDLPDRLERLEHRTPFYAGDKVRAILEGMKRRDAERKRAREQDPGAQEQIAEEQGPST